MFIDWEAAAIRSAHCQRGCSSDGEELNENEHSKQPEKRADEPIYFDPELWEYRKPPLVDGFKLFLHFSKLECRLYMELQDPRCRITQSDPQGIQWILCNLTKRQYVLRSTLDDVGIAGFGHFLLSRICWSGAYDPSYTDWDKDVVRGVWAGDRFEITTTDRVKDFTDGGWRNVGEETGKELTVMWDTYRGEGWREKVTEPRKRVEFCFVWRTGNPIMDRFIIKDIPELHLRRLDRIAGIEFRRARNQRSREGSETQQRIVDLCFGEVNLELRYLASSS